MEKSKIKRINRPDLVVGIDPDSERSGFAIVSRRAKKILTATALRFPDLIGQIARLKKECEQTGERLLIIVEAGWLNAGNWHLTRHDTPSVASKKGVGIGRNQQTGILTAEVCEAVGLDTKCVKPLRKCWSGKDRKITTAELEKICGHKLGRCNQEARDASLLAWAWADLPIVIKKKLR